MSDSRLDALHAIVAGTPRDARARFFLAHELFKAGSWADAAEHYTTYLVLDSGDVGAAWKNLGLCLDRLGRPDEAADAFRKGIVAALAHRHEGLAAEMQELLDDRA